MEDLKCRHRQQIRRFLFDLFRRSARIFAWFLLPSVPSFASGAVRTLWKKLCFLVNRILNKNLIECANIFTSNFISLRLRSRVPSKTCPFVIIFHVTASPNLYTNRLSRNILAPQFEVKSSNMWLLARVLTWDRTVTVSCDRWIQRAYSRLVNIHCV